MTDAILDSTFNKLSGEGDFQSAVQRHLENTATFDAITAIDGFLDEQTLKRVLYGSNPFLERRNIKNKFILRVTAPRIQVKSTTLEDRIQDKTVDLINVSEETREKITADVYSRIEQLRVLFLSEIAPLSLAVSPALDEAVQMLNATIGTDIGALSRIQTIFDDLIVLKFIHLAANLIDLPADVKALYLTTYLAPEPPKPSSLTPNAQKLNELTKILQQVVQHEPKQRTD
jgi:hypothetical protein